ncbi:hypothetical protein [Nocardia sp. NPDC051832]|uniref:hypothetical protein n=1 Tax=Nocardia sp. NPDC051832 TaxID=3155673 RepID=UPI0034354EB1
MATTLSSDKAADHTSRGLPSGLAPAALVASLWGASIACHTSLRGFSWTATMLSLFLAINLLICAWELVLWRYLPDIQEDYRQHGSEPADYRVIADVFRTRSRRAGFDSRHWFHVWSFYARLDRSYIERSSYGFVIDVCNGLFTLLPSLLILVMLTWQEMPARWLGVVMLAAFYQMLYGTVAYFFAYIVNRRGHAHPLSRVLVLVGGSNSIWIIFPAFGISTALGLIGSGNYSGL